MNGSHILAFLAGSGLALAAQFIAAWLLRDEPEERHDDGHCSGYNEAAKEALARELWKYCVVGFTGDWLEWEHARERQRYAAREIASFILKNFDRRDKR